MLEKGGIELKEDKSCNGCLWENQCFGRSQCGLYYDYMDDGSADYLNGIKDMFEREWEEYSDYDIDSDINLLYHANSTLY